MVQNYMLYKNIRYVAKEVNPEKADWKAKNLRQLENKISTCLSNMDPKVVQDHAKTICFRFDIMRRHGIQYLY
ncbi:hypothetical protein BpHYR1_032327 [Brachionus plicatilis]|uniref:Uncharacterized protein n=1 Tax=Brachionus plicatilis TaxID=10195 RepID=A0A3M7T177_BRAPC|nr:hypothetical protein BpHYR1_032327 [Brachionus plicatilis]